MTPDPDEPAKRRQQEALTEMAIADLARTLSRPVHDFSGLQWLRNLPEPADDEDPNECSD